MNLDGSRNDVSFEAQGWDPAGKASRLAGTTFEEIQSFGKADYPAVILTKLHSKWSCIVLHQTAENEGSVDAQKFFADLIPAISTATHRKAVPVEYGALFRPSDGKQATIAKVTFDGKDYIFVAGDLQ